MPIARIGGKLIYYAHVPKCAGSSVEDYLADRFGPLAFLDRKFLVIPDRQKWSLSSPQHIDASGLNRLFPEDFFAASFTVVRHPATRLLSSFGFHKARRRLNMRMSFDDWLMLYSRKGDKYPYLYDSHIRPMTDIVPVEACIFKLEEGTAAVVNWLDQVAGQKSGARDLPRSNATDDIVWQPKKAWKRFLKTTIEAKVPALDEYYCKKVYDLYRIDYERFGYGIFDPLEAPRARARMPAVAAGR